MKKEELKMIEQGEEMKERWEVDFMKAEEEEVYEEKGKKRKRLMNYMQYLNALHCF